jgi:Fructose-bisphosphate aldolase class-II
VHRFRFFQLGHDRRGSRPVRRECRNHKACCRTGARERISVEAELGQLGGVEEDVKVDEGACLTDPHEAVEFVKQTTCDSLAAAIGTSNGAFKFTGRQSLHFEVLEAVKEKLPGFPIVMHGSSSVPQEEVRRINAPGGKLDPTARGVDENEYLPAAKLGVTKINIDTDGRLVWTRVHREFFQDHPEQFDFRLPGKIFIEEYAKFIAHKSEKLGSAASCQSFAKRSHSLASTTRMINPADLEVPTLGPCTVESPMQRRWVQADEMEIFVSDEDQILLDDSLASVSASITRNEPLAAFELAGPRRKLFFDPAKSSCAIITCGGLCPGINDVIRGLVMQAHDRYGIRKIYGMRCGYEGNSGVMCSGSSSASGLKVLVWCGRHVQW